MIGSSMALWIGVIILLTPILCNARKSVRDYASEIKRQPERSSLRFRDRIPPITKITPKESSQPSVPPGYTCSDNIFDSYGLLDIGEMLYNCSNTIPSALFPHSYFVNVTNVTSNPVDVQVQLAINSLLAVDDLDSTCTFDLYWRILWTDPRINLDIWPHLHPNLQREGIEISAYINNQDPVNFWKPDIFFFESVEISMVDELIKLLPNGSMYWSRHIIAEFSQESMMFSNFPIDQQHFHMTLQSFAYETSFIELSFVDDTAVTSSELSDNQLWSYRSYSSHITNLLSPSPTNPDRQYSTAYITMTYTRESRGVIYRLALPVMIFLVVVGASFWAAEEQRIDITLQVLLLVSALYIIIGQSIPFVGYLTRMDTYIITVFVLLACTVCIHFIIYTFHRKAEKYPMDLFYAEALVYIFRTMWIPMAVALFTGYFPSDQNILITIVVCIGFSFIVYGYLKSGPLEDVLQAAIIKLRMKEDLVSLGAMDERTGQPIELERSEVAVLRSTNHWYRDPIYKQLLFSSDLEMLQDCLVDDPPLSQPQHHHNFPPTEGDGSAPTKNFFRVASDHSMFSASSPSKPRPALDHEASVRQVAMLVRGLKRDQTQRLSSATSAPSPVPTSEPTPVRITDRNVARYTQLSGTAAEAPSELMRSSLVEFKRTTLSEMGIFLPRQHTLQSAAWRQHLAASLPATATAMTSAHHTAESGATSDAL